MERTKYKLENFERRKQLKEMKKITLKCQKCGKTVHTDEEGMKSRMRLFKNKEDFDNNFKCKFCKKKNE